MSDQTKRRPRKEPPKAPARELTDREKAERMLDLPLLAKEFSLRKGEKDVMKLLASTWKTNHGLDSMKKAFDTVTDAAASKTSQLDGYSCRFSTSLSALASLLCVAHAPPLPSTLFLVSLAARIERMQLELCSGPGSSGTSSTLKPAAAPKGGRRARGEFSGADSAAAAGGANGAGGAVPRPSSAKRSAPLQPPKPPSEMTATERVAFELKRETGEVLETCSACGTTVPKERYSGVCKCRSGGLRTARRR